MTKSQGQNAGDPEPEAPLRPRRRKSRSGSPPLAAPDGPAPHSSSYAPPPGLPASSRVVALAARDPAFSRAQPPRLNPRRGLPD